MRSRQLPVLTSDELEKIVRKAVRDELNDAGLRLDDADHQYAARADFAFLRRVRHAVDGISSKVGASIILALVSGLLWLLWTGFNAILPPKV